MRRSSSPQEVMVLLRLQHILLSPICIPSVGPSIPHAGRTGQHSSLGGSSSPPALDGHSQLHSSMQWGCRARPLVGAGYALSIQQQATAGRPLANSSRPWWHTVVLDHLLSSASPSHLILEELGLVLTTCQSVHKAKNLGIKREMSRQNKVSGWRPP